MKKITGNKPTDLQHLLSIDEMDISLINDIFKSADKFLTNNQSIDKYKILQGKTVCNLFFENSTRTQTTFEIAAKRLSADVINLDIATSSQSKGESILDLIKNLKKRKHIIDQVAAMIILDSYFESDKNSEALSL